MVIPEKKVTAYSKLSATETQSVRFWDPMNAKNLKGISGAVSAANLQAEIQKFKVHRIQKSLRFVSWKERKPLAKDLKQIYTAATEEEGTTALEEVAEKWTLRQRDWAMIYSQLIMFFEDRLAKYA